MTDPITLGQFQEAEGVADWRLTSEGATAFFRTRSFAESARFVQAISDLQGVEDHRSDSARYRSRICCPTISCQRYFASRPDGSEAGRCIEIGYTDYSER